MSKQPNKTVIGAFVVGAIVLLTAGVLIFGSGKFLEKTNLYVLYFQGSVKGLNVGSPVMFRGVKVGSVKDISLKYEPKDLTMFIPVIVEIEQGKFQPVSGAEKLERRSVEELIEYGLKGQLKLLSVVTGQLMIRSSISTELYRLTGGLIM